MVVLNTLCKWITLLLPLSAARVLPPDAEGERSWKRTDSPSVTVRNGTYKGIYDATYNQDLFLGMPYAQPPVGPLRFRPPQPINTRWTSPRNATAYSPQCIGYGSDTWVLGNYVSEDCLTINVVRPAGVNPGAKLPVAVWIHGGGFYMGGGSDPRYNLSFIVERSVAMGRPMVAATINYRLHSWGFMHSAALAAEGSTNIGFRDQRLALHWVRENIARFGGDPDKVTIWGESAGAFSVGAQLIAYGGRDDRLFRGVILQSGTARPSGTQPTPAAAWEAYFDAVVDAVGCSSAADKLGCLRQAPTDQLSAVFNSSTLRSPGFGQVVDGDFIVAPGDALVKRGKFLKVPILIGTNYDEGPSFAPRGINTTEEFLGVVRASGITTPSAVDTIAELYPDDPAVGLPATLVGRPTGSLAWLGAQFKRVAAFIGDLRFQAGRRQMAQVWASHGVDAWSYHFNVVVTGLPHYIGAAHFQEVVFVFHNVRGLGYDTPVATNPFKNAPQTYYQLADLMSGMWINFIAKQDPNDRRAGYKHWPKYSIGKPQNMVFDVNVTGLAYAQPDTFRRKEMAYIIDNLYAN